MSEPLTYPPGAPCWVDTIQPDLEAATRFYTAVFGWEFVGGVPRDGHYSYYLAQLGGSDVAGIAPLPPMAPQTPAGWITQIRVENVERTAEAARRAGGEIIMGGFDAAPAGRLGVIADPGGAVIGLWEPLDRQGAQRVGEPNTWSASILSSGDRERSARFYADVFGWSGESAAMIVDRTKGERDHWTVDFQVADADRTLASAEAGGGSATCAPRNTARGLQVAIRDPAGAVFTATSARHS